MMAEIRVTSALDSTRFARLKQAAIFECFKWDPQVEDISVLAPFALTISGGTWEELASLSEQLAAETLAVETELAQRTDLHRRLGFSRAVCKALNAALASPAAEAARFMRFDFHLTSRGWQISEVNSDVPGGINEASGFTKLMAEELGSACSGDPARELARATAARRVGAGPVGLIHATAYADDRQVMEYMARELAEMGVPTLQLSPAQVTWRERRAFSPSGCEFGAILRFFPAEWLDELDRRSCWPEFFRARTPAANPPQALLAQSKRWPLYWDELRTPLPAWRRLLPQTVDPRNADWREDQTWVLKPALGRVGDGIGLRGATGAKDWSRIARNASWFPRAWVAQRRFETLPIQTSLGQLYPTLGVYVIDGRASGIYARCAGNALIDYRSHEAAVLVEAPQPAPLETTCVGT
jgi:glutathionylspermidine synthase